MQAIVQGDQDAFRQLMRHWKQPIVNYFYQQLWQKEAAEDLAQEVFIKVWKVNQYKNKGSFPAWLFAVARHSLIDYKRKKRLPIQNEKDNPAIESSTNLTPESQMLHTDQVSELKVALDLLKPDQRNLILMAKYEGLKYKDLAQVFQTSENNIKVKVYRTLKRLKSLLTEREAKDEKTMSSRN